MKSFFNKVHSGKLERIVVFLEDEVNDKDVEKYVLVSITLTDSKNIGYNNTNEITFYIKGDRDFFGSYAIEGDKYFWGNNSIDFSEIFGGSDIIKMITVVFGREFKCNVSMYRMFEGCENLTYARIKGVKNNCTRIVDKKCTMLPDMSRMFCGCKNLEEVNIEGKIENATSKRVKGGVRSVYNMFNGCEKLKEMSGLEYVIDGNTTSTENMLYLCKELKKIKKCDKLDTSRVDNMKSMFYGCESLPSLPDMSKWNMNRVIEMQYMCYGCKSIKEVKLGKLGSCVRSLSMEKAFRNCTKLNKVIINDLELHKEEIPGSLDISFMFMGCKELKNVSMCGWNVEVKTKTTDMFSGCENLKNVMGGYHVLKGINGGEDFLGTFVAKKVGLLDKDSNTVNFKGGSKYKKWWKSLTVLCQKMSIHALL